MLNALFVALDGADKDGVARATASMQRQGFIAAPNVECECATLRTWAFPGQRDVANIDARTSKGAAACVGPLWYRGHFGEAALRVLLDECEAGWRPDETQLRGNFALLLCTPHECLLLNDALGFVRIYASADGLFYSTSWLATCAYLQRVELDAASAIEYVLLGAAHSRHSVARGVDLLPLSQAVDLKRRCTWQRLPGDFDSGAPEFDSLDEAVEAISDHLRIVSAEVASAFPGRVNTALSGGFDSRLIVAGLLAAGVEPRLFVYGDAKSADVVVARTVAAAIGLAVDAIDKGVANRSLPVPDIESLEESALFFDGLPNDGIYDAGADRRTRLQQTAEGSIALNGGGGEIFRNFFHLPDRAYAADDIVRTFYRGFSRDVFREPGGLESYEARLATSIGSVAGVSSPGDERLSRTQVELLYPLFRCHYWMGVNNSVAVRHGHYATPLVDLTSVRLALRVPLRWKNAGAFQSRLIAALHPAIAAQPSAYGFRFDVGPGWNARLSEWATRARPVSLRPMINATRRSLQNARVAPAVWERYRALLPGEWCMDSLLDLRQLADDRALGRALSIELVWRRIF